MKWMAFIATLLALTAFWNNASARTPRVVALAESEVATVSTALGYTTILQFDARPTSAVLGDQDAFKVEYVGNGIAIKPVLSHSRTNLFVFTDYDRFNFRLVTGAASNAEYLMKVRRKGSAGYAIEAGGPEKPRETTLVRKHLRRSASCGGLTLNIRSVAWPESESSLLVDFKIEATKDLTARNPIQFEPGDLEVSQNGRLIAVESLHLTGLQFSTRTPLVEGTLVLRQSDLQGKNYLKLGFFPDFLKAKHPACPSISFSRSGTAKAPPSSTRS